MSNRMRKFLGYFCAHLAVLGVISIVGGLLVYLSMQFSPSPVIAGTALILLLTGLSAYAAMVDDENK